VQVAPLCVAQLEIVVGVHAFDASVKPVSHALHVVPLCVAQLEMLVAVHTFDASV
jgi:hypothetical protein